MNIRNSALGCLLLCAAGTAIAGLDEDILAIQQRWASVNYSMHGEEQAKAFESLTSDARRLVADVPNRAEPKVWLAIVLSSDAGATGGLSALGKVKEARQLLEEAEKIDAEVLDGSIYTSLGSLYYQVPGWPIAFGSDAKAEHYLREALTVNPDGIDPNYFFGDFLLEQGKPAEAIKYLEHAQAAPPRPNRPLADKGRQEQITRKLQLARSKISG